MTVVQRPASIPPVKARSRAKTGFIPAERQAATQQPDGTWRIKRSEEERAKHAYYYTLEALKKGVAPMYWYTPMEGPGRSNGIWNYPKLKDAIIQAWNDYKNM